MSNDMDDARAPSALAWGAALAAVLASAGWLAWVWIAKPPDLATVRVYVDGKAWERAAPMLERILEIDPKNVEAARLLGYCYHHMERYQAASRMLASSKGDEEETAAALFFSGQSLLAGQKRREAEWIWKKILAMDAGVPGVAEWQQECRRELCNMYAVERRRREFLAVSEEMFESAPPKARYIPLQYRIKGLIHVVEPNAGVKKLQTAVAADPHDYLTRAGAAVYLADLEKYDEALAQIQECRRAAPNDLFVWEVWCRILERQGDVAAVALALKSTPDGADQSAVAEQMKALAAEHRGDFDAAVAHLRKSMALDPDPGRHQRIGLLLTKQRKSAEAERHLELAKKQQAVVGEIKDFLERFHGQTPDNIRQFADWANGAAELMDRLDRVDEARRWRIAALAADASHRPSLAGLERDAVRRYGRQ